MTPRLQAIASKLAELRAGDTRRVIFGSERHDYALRPRASAGEIEAFEGDHGLRLPADYREFLLEMGDGGAGPAFGVSPLSTWVRRDPVFEMRSSTARPFLLSEAWTNTEPASWSEGALHDGCVHLAELGCGYFTMLVVQGPRAGEVWADTVTIAGGGGLAPVAATFFDWYEAWLDRSLTLWAVDEMRHRLRVDPGHARDPRLPELADSDGDPEGWADWQRLGYRALYTGDLPRAFLAFAQARDAHPARGYGVPWAYHQMMCDLYRVRGDDDARLLAAEAGIQSTAANPRVQFLWEKADVLFRRGEVDEALAALIERAGRPNNGDVQPIADAVEALLEHGRHGDAEDVIEQAVERRIVFRRDAPEARRHKLHAALEQTLGRPLAT